MYFTTSEKSLKNKVLEGLHPVSLSVPGRARRWSRSPHLSQQPVHQLAPRQHRLVRLQVVIPVSVERRERILSAWGSRGGSRCFPALVLWIQGCQALQAWGRGRGWGQHWARIPHLTLRARPPSHPQRDGAGVNGSPSPLSRGDFAPQETPGRVWRHFWPLGPGERRRGYWHLAGGNQGCPERLSNTDLPSPKVNSTVTIESWFPLSNEENSHSSFPFLFCCEHPVFKGNKLLQRGHASPTARVGNQD